MTGLNQYLPGHRGVFLYRYEIICELRKYIFHNWFFLNKEKPMIRLNWGNSRMHDNLD